MRWKLAALAALVGLLLGAPRAWAPPQPRPGPRPPSPTPRPPVRPPTVLPPVRPPTVLPLPERPPGLLPRPDFRAQLAEAQRRSAAEAAELLRRQNAASFSRAQRAAVLNQLAHQMLRQQQQAALLADLRHLRADWAAIGSGAGLDPILAMELEAAESVAERAILADVLQLVAANQFADAETKLESLESPRYLPAVVVQALPELHAALRYTLSFAPVRAELQKETVSGDFKGSVAALPPKEAAAVIRHALALGALVNAQWSLSWRLNGIKEERVPVESLEQQLADVRTRVSEELASKLRPEFAAYLFLDGRPRDATQLLEGPVDPVHAATVLADLRAIALGRGEITTLQIGLFGLTDPAPPPAVALLTPDQLAKWKAPALKVGKPTLAAAIADARAKLKAAVDAEVNAGTTRINTAVERIRAALAQEAAPLKPFLEKVEGARGKPFASAVERELAAGAGTRGFTVAETVGVLSAEADRPAAAARLLATVRAFGDPASFAVAVELAGRAPAAFAPHPDAGFKLTGIYDRARLRDAVAAVVDLRAAKVAAGRPVDALDRAALEATLAKRLGVPADAVLPLEFVQAVLDVCHDWADDHARLVTVGKELNDIVANIEAGAYGPMDDELTELLSTAKLRRLSVQFERKRREAGVEMGCNLLGEYGAAAKPAGGWLKEQLDGERPWRAAAARNLAWLSSGK
jgi:hypothetical protein